MQQPKAEGAAVLLLEQQQRPVNIPQRRGQSIATSTGRRVDGYLGGIVKLQRRPPQPSHRTSGGAGPHREIRAAVETSQGAASTADCAGSAGFKPGPLPPLSHTGPNTGVGGIVEACSSLFDAAAMLVEQPAMVAAADAALLDLSVIERCSAMAAARVEQTRHRCAVAEEDEVFPEHAHLLWRGAGVARQTDRVPVAPSICDLYSCHQKPLS